MSDNKTDHTKAILDRLQDLEFLMLFVKTDVAVLQARLNAVLMNQGVEPEQLDSSGPEAWKKCYEQTFREWSEQRVSIEKILEKHKDKLGKV